MLKLLNKNNLWLVTALETIGVGIVYLLGLHLDVRILPPFNHASDECFSWVLVLLGIWTILVFLIYRFQTLD